MKSFKTTILRLIRAINYIASAVFFEYPRGIDFSMRDKYSNSNSQLNGYAKTSTNALKNLFKLVDITNKKFLDIGSGKGAVVYDSFKLGAKISHGIEYNHKLHNIAVLNFNRLRCNQTCISINCDARYFKNYINYDVFYLFNPFNEDIYLQVMSNIKDQIANDINTKWIIAYGKSNESAIMQIGKIKLIFTGICPYRNTTFSIYQVN